MERGAVKGRFAPTPSGRMHLGNLLCALLAWLSARAEGGRVVLRIEDLDAMRSPRSYADLLEDDLRWLGLFWDEGGSSGGPDGPYYQSERTALYQAALARLEEQGLVYPCFCSRAQLHAAQAPHLSDGRVLYPGTYINMLSLLINNFCITIYRRAIINFICRILYSKNRTFRMSILSIDRAFEVRTYEVFLILCEALTCQINSFQFQIHYNPCIHS